MKNKEQKEQPEEVKKEETNQPEGTAQEEKKEEEVAAEEKPLTIEEQLEKSQQQNAELKDKYLRLYAEFDNFRKRSMKEKLEFMKMAAQDTLSALLPVLDDFDRAKKNADAEDSTEVFSEGVSLVYQKLYAVLQSQGLEPMASDGEVFDPEFHEAITDIPAPNDDMKGKIIDTIEKGYKLKDKILRHAKVVVGK